MNKHKECSNCTHTLSMYESRYRNKSLERWTPWSGVFLGSASSIRIMLDKEVTLQIITRTFRNYENQYRKISS